MRQYGKTIDEAAREWVNEFDAVQTDMLKEMADLGFEKWSEVTTPRVGDRVYVYWMPDGSSATEHGGTIENFLPEADVYLVNLDDCTAIEIEREDFEIERDCRFPMWSAMWQFHDPCDTYWLEECDGIRIMSECGFRVYDFDEYGYFFGIDGCGYDFYSKHWIPLYKARGLEWHDPATKSGSYVMSEYRRADLLPKVVDTLYMYIGNVEETREALKSAGFRENELEFLGYAVINDE